MCVPWTLSGIRGGSDLTRPVRATRQRLPWRLLIAGVAGLLGILVAAGEVSHWDTLLRFLYQVPYGQSDPLYDKDIGFYLFSLPAYVVLKNWMLLTLVLSALVAGAVYWVHGDIVPTPNAGRCPRPRSPMARLARRLLRREGLVLWSGPLSAAVWRQGRRGGRELHRCACGAAGPLGADRAFAMVAVIASWANLQVRTYRLPVAAAVLVFGAAFVLGRGVPRAVRAPVRETERVGAGEALPRAEHRADPTGPTTSIRSRPNRSPSNRT